MMLYQQLHDGIGRTGEELRILIRRIDKRNRTVLVVIDDGVSKQVFHKLL